MSPPATSATAESRKVSKSTCSSRISVRAAGSPARCGAPCAGRRPWRGRRARAAPRRLSAPRGPGRPDPSRGGRPTRNPGGRIVPGSVTVDTIVDGNAPSSRTSEPNCSSGGPVTAVWLRRAVRGSEEARARARRAEATRGSSAGNSSNSPTRCSRTRSQSSPLVRPTVATRRVKADSTWSDATSASAAAIWASRSSGAASARAIADGSAFSARARNRTCASAASACSLSGSATRICW